MLEFQEKRKLKRIVYSKITTVILLILVGFLVKAVWGVYEKQRYTKDNLNRVALDLDDLREREKRLAQEIDRLKTQDGIEAEIREKYGLVKPGEEVIVIVNDVKVKTVDAGLTNPSFWQKVWNWLQ